MAIQNWIPMRLDLARDPDVIRIGQMMTPPQRPQVVVGYLHTVWSWASEATADGTVRGLTLESVENMLSVPGFLRMMAAVGWIHFIEDANGCSIQFHEWDRWLSRSAKARLKDARKKESQRKHTQRDKCPDEKGTNVPGEGGRAVDVDVDVVLDVPKKKRRNSFTPPTVEDVAQYVCLREDGHHCNPGEFVDYFSAQGWKLSNGNAMKDWQAAVRQWISRAKARAPKQKELRI